MKYKVHWLIDGVIEIEADNIELAEKTIKDKIEVFIKDNADFYEGMGAKISQGEPLEAKTGLI